MGMRSIRGLATTGIVAGEVTFVAAPVDSGSVGASRIAAAGAGIPRLRLSSRRPRRASHR